MSRIVTRRDQLLSGKFRETPKERKEREKAENIAMREVQKQKMKDRFSKFFALIETPEFIEWYEFNSNTKWTFDPEKDDPKEAIDEIWCVYQTAIKYAEEEIVVMERVPREKTNRQERMQYAQPAWACKQTIKTIYAHRDSLNRRFPHLGPFDVDHIVPIMGRLVCGLHCEQNLRVIPKKENLEKSNKLVEIFLSSCIVHFRYSR